jgi:Phosphoglycerate dehydrogenase and related dehydrogenases
MFKIQTLNKIAAIGLDGFPREQYEIASEILNPDAILVRSADMHSMQLPASVKAIGRAGAGVNNIPVEQCSKRGIVVFNTPGANANGVKELVLAGLLLSSRRIVPGIEWVGTLKGKGKEVGPLVEKGKNDFVGPEIKGKKLGVVGLGAIGVMVANDAVALGMEVAGYDPYISVEAAWGLARTVRRATSLDMLLAQSDYITLHVPLMDQTKGMLNRDKFAMMKKGVRIVNLARGGLVKNADLIEAMKAGTVACYVTDFPDDDLLALPNVIPIPHLGASRRPRTTVRSWRSSRCATIWRTATSRTRSTSPRARCRSWAAIASWSSTRTCPTWWARSRRCWPPTRSTSPT